VNQPARTFLGWKSILGFVISGVALYFVFRNQDLGALLREVASARPLPFLAATVAGTAVFWVRAWRWKALLEPVRPGTSFRSRFAATTIGFMGNNVFPWRVGEIMRPLALARAESIPVMASVTSLVLERMLDVLTVLALLLLSMSLPGLPGLGGSEQFTARMQSVSTILLAGVLGLGAIVLWPAFAARVSNALVTKLPRRVRPLAATSADGFLRAVSALRDPGIMLRALTWSFAHWLLNGVGFWLAMRAFGLDYSFTAALFFQGILVIAVAAPSAPGFFGVYELAAAAVLVGMWGADATTSNAFAAAYHIAIYIPVTLIGLYYAHRLGVAPNTAAPEPAGVANVA
jgi:uncharacterized protein (TIRG00374 family)